MRLSGAVALVTGASSGIGEAAARALAEEGATIVAAARRKDRLEQLVSDITGAGGRSEALELDVTREHAVEGALRAIRGRHGKLDILVNAAGVMLSASVADAKPADWRRMIETNLLGLMFVTHAALPLMREGEGGHIFNISSISGRLANVGSPAYAASKNGVGAFTESLRKECAKYGIRVTLIMPGIVATELFTHVEDAAVRARFGAMLESMTVLQPRDIAAALLYALTQPQHVSISEVVVRPTEQIE